VEDWRRANLPACRHSPEFRAAYAPAYRVVRWDYARWLPLLEAAEDNWYKYLHLGMLAFAAKDWAAARNHWEKSIALTPSAWAWRNLARLDVLEKKPEAAEHYKKALDLAPTQRHLALEGVNALIKLNAYGSALEVISALPDELANLVDPATAYTNFLNRCNTKETTKLASAIIQNQSKGNAEIGQLLKSMAHEAWQDRRHTAKRDSEKANSKLMIPTMLLFLAILVMIMVPVAMNFASL